MGSSPCYSQNELVYAYQVLDLQLQWVFFWPKSHFCLFLVTKVTISWICLAHVLSWVKTYHHAKFQRNSSTGLAKIMVQTYRQRQTDRQSQRSTDATFTLRPVCKQNNLINVSKHKINFIIM